MATRKAVGVPRMRTCRGMGVSNTCLALDWVCLTLVWACLTLVRVCQIRVLHSVGCVVKEHMLVLTSKIWMATRKEVAVPRMRT